MKQKEIFRVITFLFSALLIHFDATAQKTGLTIRNENINRKISLTDILGSWYAADYPDSKISFVNINNWVVSLEGIKHGIGGYSFIIYEDSISVNGFAPNWPPFDCTLTLINRNELKMEFYQYHSIQSTSVIYKR
jgi:hypothetical protein